MATLTTAEKANIRQRIARKATANDVPISWVKGAANDAAQAVEDLLVGSATTISSVINAATSPYGVMFTTQEKKWIVALVILAKYARDIV